MGGGIRKVDIEHCAKPQAVSMQIQRLITILIANHPGGQVNFRPASMWKCKCMTSWPASGPQLVDYPISAGKSHFCRNGTP